MAPATEVLYIPELREIYDRLLAEHGEEMRDPDGRMLAFGDWVRDQARDGSGGRLTLEEEGKAEKWQAADLLSL